MTPCRLKFGMAYLFTSGHLDQKRYLMKSRLLLIFFLLLCAGGFFLSRQLWTVSIIPEPKECHWLNGRFVITGTEKIIYQAGQYREAVQLQDVIEEIAYCRLDVVAASGNDSDMRGLYLVQAEAKDAGQKKEWNFTSAMRAEGYVLVIRPEKLMLMAATPAGFYYGIQSIHFLLKNKATRPELPALILRDWPDYPLRGFSDDISRGQVSNIENFKEIIRFLSHHKMNLYLPYIEDMFQFKSFPQIGADRGALAAGEWMELQNYAELHHVQIVPIFQTLGHFENILNQPEFVHLADYPGAASLNVCREETYQFLETLLAEIAPVFRSKYFHMGADESWDVGRGASRERVAKLGMVRVLADHYHRVYELLRRYDKTVLMYGDMTLKYPDLFAEIPQDIIMVDWDYEGDSNFKSSEIMHKFGRPFWISPGVHGWRKFFPNLSDAVTNLSGFSRKGLKCDARGMIASNWCDFGAPTLRELNYYATAYSGACSWNSANADKEFFEKVFFQDFYGAGDDADMQKIYRSLDQATRAVSWMHFVSHPFYPLDDRKREEAKNRVNLLPAISRSVKNEISRLDRLPIQRQKHLDYLGYVADLFSWYARLNELQIKLDKSIGFEFDFKLLVDDLRKLKGRFAELWLRSNRPENLSYTLDLFERLARTLEIKADEIAAGDVSFNGLMPAPFLSHSNSGTKAVPFCLLRKQFALQTGVERAQLQLIADSHARVWLNEHLVGELFARRSMSAMVESQRVKVWDVTHLLKTGENTLAIEVNNYVPNSSAAANIWLEIDARTLTGADDGWKTNDKKYDNWHTNDFDDSQWPTAVKVKTDLIISRPNLAKNLSSRIEFYK